MLTATDASTITTTDLPTTSTMSTKITTILPQVTEPTDASVGTTTEMDRDVTTVLSILSKDPRLGDNDITASPPTDDISTTTMTNEKTVTSTESSSRTTSNFISNNTMTRRPATRFDTTLEIEDHRNASTTTETPSTTSIVMMPEMITETVAGTTITIDSRLTQPDETTPATQPTIVPNVRQKCSSQMDCHTNEKCISNECLKICQTNGTKSDDCVQGIYDCRYCNTNNPTFNVHGHFGKHSWTFV